MKNPFEKEDHTGLIIGIALGVTAGIELGWLYLTQNGGACRKKMSSRFKEGFSDTLADLIDKKTIFPKKVAKVATDAVIKK